MIAFQRRCVAGLVVPLIAQVALAQAHFMRGDPNHDRRIDVSDGVFTLRYLFGRGRTPPCLDAADVDDNGDVQIGDVIRGLGYLFADGPAPAAPYPTFEADPTADTLTCLPEVAGPVTAGGSELGGDITADVTLAADKTYRMISRVYVKAGATLTIEPGVTVLADAGAKPFLAIERGAKIMAVGTETHPIVFTSSKPVGQRARADWAGVLVIGRGPVSVPGGEWQVRGIPGLMAGGGANPDPDDSSGRLSYVRVEYAGANVASGVPQTALAFYANGTGTEADHIETKYGADDGLEWYGGLNSLKYGIAVGIGDEACDCQFGWSGRAQFIVCLQRKDMGNHGFQNGDEADQPPITNPVISNVTFVGAYQSGSRSDKGLLIQYTAGMSLYNGIFQGWHVAGLEFGDDPGPATIDRCAFYGNAVNCRCNPAPCPCSSLFAAPLQNVASTVPVIVDAGNLDNPDLRGIEAALPPPIDPTTIDPWFDPAPYVGAVPPEGRGKDWTRAPWVSWQQK